MGGGIGDFRRGMLGCVLWSFVEFEGAAEEAGEVCVDGDGGAEAAGERAIGGADEEGEAESIGIGGGAGGTLAADGSVDEEVGEFGGVGVGELSVVEEFDLDIAVVDGECSEVDELVLAVGIELCDAVEERFLEA